MTEIQIVRGDKNFILNFTIYDADNQIVNLTGVSAIKFKFKSYEDGTVTEIVGSVVNADAGEAQFPVAEQFVGITGEFKAEIEITYLSGKVITAPNISIKVVADIA